MKKTAKIMALLLLAVTTMVSCTKNNSSNDGNQNANLIVGKWKCEWVSESHYTNDYLDNPFEVGDICEFYDDGFGQYTCYRHEEYGNYSWTEDFGYTIDNILVIMPVEHSIPFKIEKISNDSLVLNGIRYIKSNESLITYRFKKM